MNIKLLASGAAPLAIAVAFGWGAPALAQDELDSAEDAAQDRTMLDTQRNPILVTGTRDASLAREDFTGSVSVINPDQIKQRQIRDVEDVLRDVPGVAVSAIAGQTQIRLRGSEANHVLVLVDGIEVSDPGSGEFDIGTLQAEIGSRVEVLRGPQSALYGNDALAGVVAYESASGRDLEGLSAFLEGGTNNTLNGAARYGAQGTGWDAALSAIVVTTDGEPNARAGTRDIGRDSYTLSGRGSVDATDGFSLRAAGRYVLTQGDFNDQDFGFGSPTFGLVIDSPATEFENEAVYGLLGARLETSGGDWTHDLSVQFADANRNTSNAGGVTSDNESDRFKASYVSAFDFGGSDHTLTFAADYELEGFNNAATFDDRKSVENIGFVGEYGYAGERFDFAAALRHDINDRFEDATTFRIGAGYRVTDTTRIRASVGSGVKNPTLNELFGFFDGVFVGNPDLSPEKSVSWEVGLDQTIAGDAITISATYFNAELEDEIFTAFPAPTFIQTPGNRTSDSTQQGIELAVSALLGGGFSLNGAYTFLDAEENGAEEVRRPDHIASAVLNWSAPGDTASVNLAVRYNGGAVDSDFTAGTFPAPFARLEDYTLVNLNARVALTEGVNLFGRVENLLDQRYEQVFTFVSPGINVLGGVEVRF